MWVCKSPLAVRRTAAEDGKEGPLIVTRWTRFAVVLIGLAVLAVDANMLCAQTTIPPSDQQGACSDGSLGVCRDTTLQGVSPTMGTDATQSRQTMGNTSDQRSVQRMSQDDTPYVDVAGNVIRSPQTTRDIRRPTFPPDPITDLQRLAKASIGEQLHIFGRDLFREAPSTFAPGDQIAVTPNYIIGPGDDLLVRLWGPESFNSRLTVDRSGSIYIPRVGAIHVAGLRFDELEAQVSKELSRTYRNFNLTVNLGRLRSIQVYVVGEAQQPGAYTVSSLSTVLNALFASGGPNVQGSLRHIQVRRVGQSLPEFDLYDFVRRGDKSHDIPLEQGDTIVIPPVGAQVALGGSVRHPAIYELANETTLEDVLKLAGGFSATAARAQVRLERIEPDLARHAMSVALDAEGRGMTLRDGDVLYVNHITAGYEQSVTIRGNLANPGRFSWHEGMHLSDIIPDRMSLLTNDYWRERNRLGVPVPLFEPLEPNNRMMLQNDNGFNNDRRSTQQQANGRAGAYDQTGNLQQQQQQQNNSDGQTDVQGNTLEQLPPTDLSQTQVDPLLGGIFLGSTRNTNNAVPLQGNGNTVPASPESLPAQRPTDELNARVKNKIEIPAPEIDWSYAVIERLDPKTLKSSLVPFNLGRLVEDHDLAQNLELRPGDVVTILSQNDVLVPQDAQTKYVRLEGEFVSSGVYSVSPNETLDELVARSGGLTTRAYLYGSSFRRESARIFQQQRLDEYISSLSTDMERSAAVRAASSNTGILDPNSLAEQRSLIAQLRQLRATGRVVLEFGPNSVGVASIPKIPLENGDVFHVSSRPNTVSVIGAVYGQNVFLYDPGRKLENYISLAGKPNRIADRKHAFIIRADGSIYSRERAQGVLSNSFDSARINPGDAIVIPEKLIKPSALRNLIDYSQILSSFGLAAAAINVVR